MDFPVALRKLLLKTGYISDAAFYPLPSRRHAAPRAPAAEAAVPAMNQCVGSSDTVRRLIYQTFLGRKLRGEDSPDLVSLQNDTTVEANDPNIGRLVCAVSYELNLRSLIGRLAEDGDLQRASILSRLMRRSGPVASNRVKYSVKPTAMSGQSFVELLP